MAKFQMKETVGTDPITARLGAGTGTSNYVTDLEIGKAVKLVGDSRYDLCAAGNPIEGFITAVEGYTADDYSIGSVQIVGRKRVLLDGSEAAGTGSIAVGDFVVAGTAVAKGTAVGVQKVRKATNQPGATPTAWGDVAGQINNLKFGWRVVSLEGNGSVGTYGVIERVTANI